MPEQFDEVILPQSQEQFDEVIPAEEASDNHNKATQLIQEVSQGLHPDMTEEELLPIMKVESQDASGNQTTPGGRLLKNVKSVATMTVGDGWNIAKSLANDAVEGIKGVYKETGDAPHGAIPTYQTEKTLAAGALGDTGSFLGGTAINASAGTANLISEAAEKLTGQKFADPDLTNARAAIMEGKMNHAIKSSAKAIDVDPESSTYHLGGLAGQALIPIGGEAKAASTVAKTAEKVVSAAPKVLGATLEKGAQIAQKPIVQAAAMTATGHPIAGLGILAEHGLEKRFGSLGGWLMNTRRKIMDATLGKIEGLGSDLRALPEGPYRESLIQDAQSVVEKNNARLQSIAAKEEIAPDAYVFQKHPDGSYVHPEEFLPKPEKEIRKIQLENENQADKIAQLSGASDFHKVTSYAAKLGLASAGNVGVGMGIGGIIGGINAQPGDDESAKRMAVMMGAFAAPFAPIHASRALRDIRAEAGREAFKEAGKDSIGLDHPNYEAHQEAYNGLTPEGKDAVDVAVGMLKSMGGKGVVILPTEEFIKMQGGDASKAPGRGFVRDGTIYLNGEHASQGVLGHEIAHFLPQALGQSAFEILPGLKEKMAGKNSSQAYKDFENYYNSLSPEKGNIPEEVLAETGRRVLADMPPELFYGGESGADVLKRWGGKILEKVAPEWYRKNNIDPVLKTPISKADEAAVRSKLFEIGERKGQEPSINVPDEPPDTTIPPDPLKAATEPTVSAEQPISAPSGAVEALIGLGEKKASAQAKVDAATAEILSENGQPTLEEVVRRAVQKTVPQAIQSTASGETPLGRASSPLSESSLAQAKAPNEERSAAAKAPPVPVPIVETPALPSSASLDTESLRPESPTKTSPQNLIASPEIKAETPIVSSEKESRQIEPLTENRATMLVGPRTDKYGRKSVSGRKFYSSWPDHQKLAKKAGLNHADVLKLEELSDKMGETVGIDYSHAPEEGLGRKESQKKTLAQARIEGAKREKLSKTFVPTWIEFTSGTNKAVIRGFSPDKFYENVSRVFENHPEVMEPYSGVNDPKLIQDFQNYAENHANGYTGMGKPIEGTELTPVKQNPDYKPHVIPEDRANVINLLMGDTSAAEGVRKASPVKLEKRALAKANAPFFDSATGETNKIRATKSDMGLESVSETLRPELIDKIRDPYVADQHTIRPVFKDDAKNAALERAKLGLNRASLAKSGTLNSTYAASGFFPDGGSEVALTSALKEHVGRIKLLRQYDGTYNIAAQHKGVDFWESLGTDVPPEVISQYFGKDAIDPNRNDAKDFPLPDDFKGKTIEAGEPPWSIRLKELETREWNGAKLTDPEQKELLDLHKQAAKEYGSYANWFEKMGAEKDYISGVFGEGKQKPTQFMPESRIQNNDKPGDYLVTIVSGKNNIASFQVGSIDDAKTEVNRMIVERTKKDLPSVSATATQILGKTKGKLELGEKIDVHPDSFMPAPHIEREAERLGLQYKGEMENLLLFNDPITKSTISVNTDAEKGALQEKLKASREKFGAEDKTSFMPDAPMDDEQLASLPEHQRMIAEEAKSVGAEIWNDGTITVYHATTKDKAGQIVKSGMLMRPGDAPDSYGVYVSSSPSVASDYGDGTLVKLRVKLSDLNPDDIFPGRRMDFLIKTREGKYTPTEIIQSMPNSPLKVPDRKSPQPIKSLRAVKPPDEQKEKQAPIDFKIGTKGSGYNTPLTAKEVIEFDKWKAKYAPNDSGDDYDLRGAFKMGLKPKNGHWPDTFKKPNHPTFSNESVYANEDAGKWNGEKFIPKQKKLSDSR